MIGEIEKVKEEFKKIKLPQHMKFYNIEDKFLFELRSLSGGLAYKYVYYLTRINWKKKTAYIICGGFGLVTSTGIILEKSSWAVRSLLATIKEFKSNPQKYKKDWSILDGGDLGLPWNEQ